MLKKLVNHAMVDLIIKPIDPMLIKSGQSTVSGVDMAFVKTYRFKENPEPFIPGSSMKGVVRSYAEKICRSLREVPVPVCLPYVKPGSELNGEQSQASCGLRIENFPREKKNRISTADIYRISCPVCRLFGSHRFIGRLATSDGYLTEDFKKTDNAVLEIRDGVAIDRLTGGPAGGAKYDLEVLTKGEFGTRIEIQNFERWQIGLLGLVLRDMCDGFLRIGTGKNRGLGRIKASVNRFEISYFGKPQKTLAGLWSASTNEERKAYGFFPETGNTYTLPESRIEGLRHTYDLTAQWPTVCEPAVQDLVAYVKDVHWPREIDAY